MNLEINISGNKGQVTLDIDGKPAGAMTFSVAREDLIIIDHTEVDEEFRGKSVGKDLLFHLVDYLRKNNIKAMPLCPFARSVFQRTPEISDVLRG